MQISVVMPNYNCKKYLSQAIESILGQSFTDFEFIIVDDCSTDKSWTLIQSYAKKDKRIRAFRNSQNKGVSATLNVGLSHACGVYIARMDSDDVSVPSRFEKQLALIKKGYDVVGSNIKLIDTRGFVIGSRRYDDNIDSVIRIQSPLAHPSVMFKRELIEKFGKYNEQFQTSQDYDLWLRFYSRGIKFGLNKEYLLKYRIHDSQVKSLKTKKSLKTTIQIKQYAKAHYGIHFGFFGKLRIVLEHILLLLPDWIILKLFFLIRSLQK